MMKPPQCLPIDRTVFGHPALHYQTAHTLVYCAFDLLHVDGRYLTAIPLGERRDAVANVLTGSHLLR